MLNQSGFVTTTGIAPTQILFNVDNQLSVGIRVANTGVVADANGKKIIKAGTPLTGSLTARTTAYTLATTADTSDAVGVLLHDVDVTGGTVNGTLLIWGFVNVNRVDNTVSALYTDAVKEALAGKVTFLA